MREGHHVAEMQRRRLLLAFGEILAEDGFESAGVGRVCARAGVSRRTFYDLFGDREACFAATFDAAAEHIRAGIEQSCTRERSWLVRTRAGLMELLALLDCEPGLARICLIEPLKAGPGMLRRRQRALDELAAAIDGGRSHVRGRAEPAPLTAQSTVGGIVSVIVVHLIEPDAGPLLDLAGALMSMIVQPYLGPSAARRELQRRPSGRPPGRSRRQGRTGPFAPSDPSGPPIAGSDAARDELIAPGEPAGDHIFEHLPIRITFRTARVLATIAAQPDASNRQIGDGSGVLDQGQISKLLRRLADAGLVENRSPGHEKGEPNAWRLTARGQSVQQAIGLPA